MSLKIVVLAKQVPDTRNVGKDAMTAEGTVNRAALPAIFNPEDLNALEQALRLKEQNPGSTVGILTMGPPRAAEIIRQGLYRGADTGWLLTDRLFAGADTLATSYALATAIQKIGDVDIVIGGRQAIDGDTAQVGPQVAQKLGLNQVTYAENIEKCEDGKLTIRRLIDGGAETVEAPLPVVVTVNGSAAPCRPCNAKLVMKYKRDTAPMERQADDAYNYGAIGVVIGHEMTHGFDDQGSQFDKDGNLSNWWTEADKKAFAERTAVMERFFNGIEVLPGLKANGKLTLGENIADHGGLNVAYLAFQNAQKAAAKPAVDKDGFTPEQRFFLSYSFLWANNVREEMLRKLTKTDPHSAGRWRVNGALPHIDAWYEAFNIKKKDPLFVPKAKRVDVW